MFFSGKNKRRLVKGAEFRRKRGHDWVEQATIVWVGEDRTGIPHVKFRLTGPGGNTSAETRLLACTAFEQQFKPAALRHA